MHKHMTWYITTLIKWNNVGQCRYSGSLELEEAGMDVFRV